MRQPNTDMLHPVSKSKLFLIQPDKTLFDGASGFVGGSRVDESVLLKGIDKAGRVRVSEQGLRLSESVKSAFKCWI